VSSGKVFVPLSTVVGDGTFSSCPPPFLSPLCEPAFKSELGHLMKVHPVPDAGTKDIDSLCTASLGTYKDTLVQPAGPSLLARIAEDNPSGRARLLPGIEIAPARGLFKADSDDWQRL